MNVLTVVEDCTKQSTDIVVDLSISGEYVARVLNQAGRFRCAPHAICADQGPEFTDKALNQRAYAQGVQWKPIALDKPTQNSFIESFQWPLSR